MSAIIGLAIREGIITDLDKKMMDYFPEYEYLNLDPRKYNTTIRDLLQMKGGINFNDTHEDWIQYAHSPDWGKYALELPLVHDPGESWHYSTPQTNLLSIIFTKESGMSTKEFADTHLYEPLGIHPAYWGQDPQGYYKGGHEMYFTPRDLARFGLLYLNNGSIDGKQIVPKEWVLESTTDYAGVLVEEDIAMTEGVRSTFYRGTGYGYQWWTKEIDGYWSYSARGFGGQFVYCFPELEMVVVTTASGDVDDYYPEQYSAIINLIEYNIMAAIDS
jgi:CubicO group peptidase (beta-lactamase class C family)